MSEHQHAFRIIAECNHPVELGKLGYAVECACGHKEHRWTQTLPPAGWCEPPFAWLRRPAMSEEEMAEAIREERERCLVGVAE